MRRRGTARGVRNLARGGDYRRLEHAVGTLGKVSPWHSEGSRITSGPIMQGRERGAQRNRKQQAAATTVYLT